MLPHTVKPVNKCHPRERKKNVFYRQVVFIWRLLCFILSRNGCWSVTFIYRMAFYTSLTVLNIILKRKPFMSFSSRHKSCVIFCLMKKTLNVQVTLTQNMSDKKKHFNINIPCNMEQNITILCETIRSTFCIPPKHLLLSINNSESIRLTHEYRSWPKCTSPSVITRLIYGDFLQKYFAHSCKVYKRVPIKSF